MRRPAGGQQPPTDVVLGAAELARIEAAVPAGGWAGDRQSFAVPGTRRGAGTDR